MQHLPTYCKIRIEHTVAYTTSLLLYVQRVLVMQYLVHLDNTLLVGQFVNCNCSVVRVLLAISVGFMRDSG